MPNGFHALQKKEFERLEAPFLEIDELLQECAQTYRVEIEKNCHNWPRCHVSFLLLPSTVLAENVLD